MPVRRRFVWVRHDSSSCESMFAVMSGINGYNITDLIMDIILIPAKATNMQTCICCLYLQISSERKQGRHTLTCTHRLGMPPICERLSSFPLQPAHSVTPVTLACLWQSRDFPLVWLQHPGCTLPTMVEKPSYCTSTAWGQQLCCRSKGSKEGGRESVPLHSSAVTTPARPGKESAPLTSPRRSAAPRYMSSVFT